MDRVDSAIERMAYALASDELTDEHRMNAGLAAVDILAVVASSIERMADAAERSAKALERIAEKDFGHPEDSL